MIANTQNLSVWEAEKGRSQVQDQLGQFSYLERPYLKKEIKRLGMHEGKRNLAVLIFCVWFSVLYNMVSGYIHFPMNASFLMAE